MIGRRGMLGGLVAMTVPGLGGQQAPPQNAAPAAQLVPGVQPGVTGQIIASRVIIIGSGGELLVYTPSAGAGNLIASVAGAAGTDQYGNHFLLGVADYGSTFATQLAGGFIQFYTGSLAAGWSSVATIQTSGTGGLFLDTTSGQINLTAATAVSTNLNTLDDGSGNMTVAGKLSIFGGTAMPNTTANPGHQSAAPAAYSQSYEQATTNRLNDVLDILAASEIWPF